MLAKKEDFVSSFLGLMVLGNLLLLRLFLVIFLKQMSTLRNQLLLNLDLLFILRLNRLKFGLGKLSHINFLLVIDNFILLFFIILINLPLYFADGKRILLNLLGQLGKF